MTKRAWLAVVLCLPAIGAQDRPFRGDYPKDGVYWEKSFRDAIGEACGREVPMMITLQKDKVDASGAMAAVFADKKYIETSRMWANVVAHPGNAHEVEAEIDKKRTVVCDRYWNVPCTTHMGCDNEVRNAYRDGRSVKLPDETPAVLFLNSEGTKELGRLVGPIKTADLIKAQEAIIANFTGLKVPPEPWREAKVVLAEGEELHKKAEWQKAIAIFQKLEKSTKWEGIKRRARLGLSKVNLVGEEKFGTAFKMTLDTKNKKKMEEAKGMLREVVKDFKGLPVSEKAESTLRQLKAHGH